MPNLRAALASATVSQLRIRTPRCVTDSCGTIQIIAASQLTVLTSRISHGPPPARLYDLITLPGTPLSQYEAARHRLRHRVEPTNHLAQSHRRRASSWPSVPAVTPNCASSRSLARPSAAEAGEIPTNVRCFLVYLSYSYLQNVRIYTASAGHNWEPRTTFVILATEK